MRKATPFSIITIAILTIVSGRNIYADTSDSAEDQPMTMSETASTQVPIPAPKPEIPNPITPPEPLIDTPIRTTNTQPTAPKKTTPVTAFTGKITKNKVRMRLQPNLESIILRELNNGDMLVVTGESEDFYAVQPRNDIKGYIFRTFVLDGVVEGNHVNVRIQPDLTAAVITQMNSGDRINGTISDRDKKWIEIALPESTRFFIAKEYIQKVGDAGYLSRFLKRRGEVETLLVNATQSSQFELQKPFNQISIDGITKDLQAVINNYSDFTAEGAKAKELLATIQTAYLSKKVAYMESNAKTMAAAQPVQIVAAEPTTLAPSTPANSSRMSAWQAVEQPIYANWSEQNSNASIEEFYKDQAQNAVTLSGVVEPYNRPIKNKPGDYVLVSQSSHLPVAYLYSTQVNLLDKVGQEVTIRGIQRDSRHFAYPAYFVLSVE